MNSARRRFDRNRSALGLRATSAWLVAVVALCSCGSSTPPPASVAKAPAELTASPSDTSEPTTTMFTTAVPTGSLTERLNHIATEQPGVLRSTNSDGQATIVTLRADQQALADELLGTYGSAVHVRLGNFDYPLDPSTATDVCPAIAEWPHATDELTATVTLTNDTVAPGADFTGTLTVTNVGARQVVLGSGPYTPVVRDRGTRAVIGTELEIAYGGSDMVITLQPGDHHTFEVTGTTASCDPTLGAALPPGTYDVTVDLLGPELDRADRCHPTRRGPGPSSHQRPLTESGRHTHPHLGHRWPPRQPAKHHGIWAVTRAAIVPTTDRQRSSASFLLCWTSFLTLGARALVKISMPPIECELSRPLHEFPHTRPGGPEATAPNAPGNPARAGSPPGTWVDTLRGRTPERDRGQAHAVGAVMQCRRLATEQWVQAR